MSVVAIRKLLAKGMSIEDALDLAQDLEGTGDKAMERRRARNARYYDSRRDDLKARALERKRRLKPSETVLTPASETVLNRLKPQASETVLNPSETVLNLPPTRAHVRADDNLLTTELSGKEEKKERKNIGEGRLKPGSPPTPRSILLEGLSSEDADAVIAHRRRCPMTPRAARLLLTEFMSTGDPHAAVDMMILRGWRGFKRAWFDNERAGNGQGRQGNGKGSQIRDAADRVIAKLEREFGMPPDYSGEEREEARLMLPRNGVR
jgi:hypothetical protein